jgi:hypothetical protein
LPYWIYRVAEPLLNRYRGLILSATELKALNPEWSDRMIEDYLELLRFLFEVSNEVDIKNNIIKATTVVAFADTPYTPLVTDEEIFFDTTDGPIDCSLPPGIDGTNYRLINVGFAGNDVTMIPALTDKLFGLSANELIHDSEVILMTFDDTIESWY